MENTSSNNTPKKDREVFYFRQRMKNRVFSKIVSFFAEEAERRGITKRDIATSLKRDPAQISRWLSSPSNMTLETISDILLAMDAEIAPPLIVRFSDRPKPNHAHPLIDAIVTKGALEKSSRDRNSVKITLAPSALDAIKGSVNSDNPLDRIPQIEISA